MRFVRATLSPMTPSERTPSAIVTLPFNWRMPHQTEPIDLKGRW